MTSYRITDEEHDKIQQIFVHARNRNLLWRYEILEANGLEATDWVKRMEDDIFWDLSEINPDLECTKSLKITNLPLQTLPAEMSTRIQSYIVDFSNNDLNHVPAGFFSNTPNVRILRFANNQLTELPWQELSQLTYLKVIDLRNNPWDKTFLEKFHSYLRMFHPHLQRLFI
ncbi:MAG: leucine-rich repeat domain-containing protein [Candidatus Kariarchaeaceae archaeon]|jgi:hypothetical protein